MSLDEHPDQAPAVVLAEQTLAAEVEALGHLIIASSLASLGQQESVAGAGVHLAGSAAESVGATSAGATLHALGDGYYAVAQQDLTAAGQAASQAVALLVGGSSQ